MNSWHIRLAANIVEKGGVIAYPTEAVYGLGCSPWNGAAVSRLRKLKHRNKTKGLIVVAAYIEQLDPLIKFTDEICTSSVLSSWPGPVTWVMPARKKAPDWLKGEQDNIAVRVSAHPVVRMLCKSTGLLVSTSANPEGRIPATTAFQVRTYFNNKLDYIVSGQVGANRKPTEIRDALTGKILRKSS